ncbi:hypothetical protein AB3N60_05390 [Leptospira sp. WS39.C2]
MKTILVLLKLIPAIVFFVNFLTCVSNRPNSSYITLEEPAEPMKSYNIEFAKKYGTNSECLVLMEGPVPSRLEPCLVGDFRSASMMYQETEVKVTGDSGQFEWQITGMVYSPFVNEAYYQSAILYRGSFFRKSDYQNYRRPNYPMIAPYLGRPSYQYHRRYYPYGR